MTPDRAARRIVRVATSDALATVTGHCFAGSLKPISVPRRARDASARARLWELSQTLTNAPDVTAMLGVSSGVAR
jgi:hypothetical protein